MGQPNEVKAAIEAGVVEWLRSRLVNSSLFQDPKYGFSFTSALSVDSFEHPSIVACCERAPLVEEDTLVYELPLELFVTTLARGDGFVDLHNDRLEALQKCFGEDGITLKEGVENIDPRFNIFRIEAGESENFTDNMYWVDKQPFTVFTQFNI